MHLMHLIQLGLSVHVQNINDVSKYESLAYYMTSANSYYFFDVVETHSLVRILACMGQRTYR